MTRLTRLARLVLLLMLVGLVALAAGCSKEMQQSQNDADLFIEAWKRMAEQSQGHSPSAIERDIEIEDTAVEDEDILAELDEEAEVKPLPQTLVSLRMHNANIKGVLQALSRAGNQSMILSPRIEGEITVNIQDKPWSAVFLSVLNTNALSYAWEGDILRIMTVADMEADLQLEVIRKKRKTEQSEIQQVEPLYASVIPIKYASASDLTSELENFLTTDKEGKSRGTISVNTHSNSLIVKAIRSDIQRLVKLVNKLDQPRKQINIKAHIVSTTLAFQRQIGVRWGGVYKLGDDGYLTPAQTGGTFGVEPTDVANQTGTTNLNVGDGVTPSGASGAPFFSAGSTNPTSGLAAALTYGDIGGNLLEAQLQAYQNRDKLRILSNPTLTTLDNQTAYTTNGEEIPYQTTSDEGTKTEFKEAVTKLQITPHIIDETQMKLQILVTKDERGDDTDAGPAITTRVTETTLIIRDGETVVIGGLSDSNKQDTGDGIPYAADIPVLGYLFGSKSKRDTFTETLFFITPNILREWREGERQKSFEEVKAEVAAEREAAQQAAKGQGVGDDKQGEQGE